MSDKVMLRGFEHVFVRDKFRERMDFTGENKIWTVSWNMGQEIVWKSLSEGESPRNSK